MVISNDPAFPRQGAEEVKDQAANGVEFLRGQVQVQGVVNINQRQGPFDPPDPGRHLFQGFFLRLKFLRNVAAEFFQQIFGGMQNFNTTDFRRPRSTRGDQPPMYQSEISISLLEAFQGTTRRIDVGGRRLEVKIPRGARTGTKVRVSEAITSPEGEKSDIFLVVQVADDPNFERKGNDLYTQTEVDLLKAVLGDEVPVKTLTGTIILTIPAGTQPGQTIRLAGQGMPAIKNPDTRGDLFVRIKVKIPRQLSAEQRELFERLARLSQH